VLNIYPRCCVCSPGFLVQEQRVKKCVDAARDMFVFQDCVEDRESLLNRVLHMFAIRKKKDVKLRELQCVRANLQMGAKGYDPFPVLSC